MTEDYKIRLDKLILESREQEVARRFRRKHSYVVDLVEVLKPHPNGLPRRVVLNTLKQKRKANDLPIPPKFEEAVQSVYNQYSVDSLVYKKRKAPRFDGLFFSPYGKGSGIWAVHGRRAEVWVNSKAG